MTDWCVQECGKSGKRYAELRVERTFFTARLVFLILHMHVSCDGCQKLDVMRCSGR